MIIFKTIVSMMLVTTAMVAPAYGEECAFDLDRQAILSMAGEYRVSFDFRETLEIAADYELHKPYHSEATELVKVVEDTGQRISLQHLLVIRPEDGRDARVVKHWRQDWTYEDTDLLVYRGGRTWERRTLSQAEATGTWTQAVYQTDDSPRYESFGKWTHLGDRSAWESGETWRPLPRREYTQRDDYDVMLVHNRHTVTPWGWAHEQDNMKVVLDEHTKPSRVLAHEYGLNRYHRARDVNFVAAKTYWQATYEYWGTVREAWKEALRDRTQFTLHENLDGKRLSYLIVSGANEAEDKSNVAIADQQQTDKAITLAKLNAHIDKFIED